MRKAFKRKALIFSFVICCIALIVGGCEKFFTSTKNLPQEQTEKTHLSDKQTEAILTSGNLSTEEQNQIATEFINQIDAMVQEELKEYAGSSNEGVGSNH